MGSTPILGAQAAALIPGERAKSGHTAGLEIFLRADEARLH